MISADPVRQSRRHGNDLVELETSAAGGLPQRADPGPGHCVRNVDAIVVSPGPVPVIT